MRRFLEHLIIGEVLPMTEIMLKENTEASMNMIPEKLEELQKKTEEG